MKRPLMALAASALLCIPIRANGPAAGIAWSFDYMSQLTSISPFAGAMDASDNVYLGCLADNLAGSANFEVVKVNAAGTFGWEQYISTDGYVKTGGIALGAQNAPVIAVGSFRNASSFDFATILTHADGTAGWNKFYNGALNGVDSGEAIATDSTGNIYVSGPQDEYTSVPKLGILKYSPTGMLLWARTYAGIPGTTDLSKSQICVDPSGNVYVNGTDAFVVNGANRLTSFALKYTTTGALVYANPYISTDFVESDGIRCDSSGNAYVLMGDYVSGPPQVAKMRTVKYSPTGAVLWNTGVPGAAPTDFGVDPFGQVYMTGILAPANPEQIVLAKLNASGSFLWKKSYVNGGLNSIPYRLKFDGVGYVYLTGLEQVQPSLADDAFVCKYDGAGNLKWALDIQQGFLGGKRPVSLDVDSNGDVFLGGNGQSNYAYGAFVTRITQTPVAYKDTYQVSSGKTFTGNVLKNDLYANGGTAVADTSTSYGALHLAGDGSFTYSPEQGFTGTDSFNYQVQKAYAGGFLQSNIVTVTLTVK